MATSQPSANVTSGYIPRWGWRKGRTMEDETASLEAYLFNRHLRPLLESPTARNEALGRTTHVFAKDGYPLAASIFEPLGKAHATGGLEGCAPLGKAHATGGVEGCAPLVVVASATGVRREYYAPFASWLAMTRGFRVVTFDYRGIGGSRPTETRGGMARFEAKLVDWAELDLASVLRWSTTEFGSGPRRTASLVGHSVGGQLLGLLPEPGLLRSVVMVGSQCGDFRLWPKLTDRALYGALWFAVVPSVISTFGYLPGSLGIGEDLPRGVAGQWARWCRTPGYMVGGKRGAARREGYRRLRAPILAFGFDDDDYAPPAAVSALLALYENARITRRQISTGEKVGHFGFFREKFEPTFWEEAAKFLEATSSPPEVGAGSHPETVH